MKVGSECGIGWTLNGWKDELFWCLCVKLAENMFLLTRCIAGSLRHLAWLSLASNLSFSLSSHSTPPSHSFFFCRLCSVLSLWMFFQLAILHSCLFVISCMCHVLKAFSKLLEEIILLFFPPFILLFCCIFLAPHRFTCFITISL